MDFVIFKNKYAKYRKENFGGIAIINNFTSILNKNEYGLLNKIDKKKYIKESSLDSGELNMAKKLLYNKILLKLDSKKAEEILNYPKNFPRTIFT